MTKAKSCAGWREGPRSRAKQAGPRRSVALPARSIPDVAPLRESTKEEEATETPPSVPTTDWAEQGPRRFAEAMRVPDMSVNGVARKARH
jgi:hypothetical protein